MKHTRLMLLTLLIASSLLYSRSPAAAPTPGDTTIFNPDSLKGNFPHLWERVGRSPKISKNDSLTGRTYFNRDSAIVQELKKQSRGSRRRAAELDQRIYFEDLYIKNKPELDIARGKFVMNPYFTNCMYLDMISDPSPSLEPRKDRLAMKWQLSFQFPLLTAKYSNTGLFFAFTNLGTFDVFNKDDSRPVTHKTFMPEVFLRLDLAGFIKPFGIDQVVLQAGIQHESNGGVNDKRSLLDSRSIFVKPYLQTCVKLWPVPPDSCRRYLLSDRYALLLSVRGMDYHGIDENPDIAKYCGYVNFNGSVEFAPHLRLGNSDNYLGVMMFDAFFAPGGSTDPLYPSYAAGISWTPPMFSNKNRLFAFLPKIPLTPYVRFFHGYNEFLYSYNKPTTVVGFGVKYRH